jgi:hypothetical protein
MMPHAVIIHNTMISYVTTRNNERCDTMAEDRRVMSGQDRTGQLILNDVIRYDGRG